MELTMTNGFSELSFNEMEMVDGGIKWGKLFDACFDKVCGEVQQVGGLLTMCVPDPTRNNFV